jgi:hypothetical protein
MASYINSAHHQPSDTDNMHHDPLGIGTSTAGSQDATLAYVDDPLEAHVASTSAAIAAAIAQAQAQFQRFEDDDPDEDDGELDLDADLGDEDEEEDEEEVEEDEIEEDEEPAHDPMLDPRLLDNYPGSKHVRKVPNGNTPSAHLGSLSPRLNKNKNGMLHTNGKGDGLKAGRKRKRPATGHGENGAPVEVRTQDWVVTDSE